MAWYENMEKGIAGQIANFTVKEWKLSPQVAVLKQVLLLN